MADLVRKAVKKFQGKDVNVDLAKLKGEWKGFFRVRKGDLRIIAKFNFDESSVFIDEIDWRGNIY